MARLRSSTGDNGKASQSPKPASRKDAAASTSLIRAKTPTDPPSQPSLPVARRSRSARKGSSVSPDRRRSSRQQTPEPSRKTQPRSVSPSMRFMGSWREGEPQKDKLTEEVKHWKPSAPWKLGTTVSDGRCAPRPIPLGAGKSSKFSQWLDWQDSPGPRFRRGANPDPNSFDQVFVPLDGNPSSVRSNSGRRCPRSCSPVDGRAGSPDGWAGLSSSHLSLASRHDSPQKNSAGKNDCTKKLATLLRHECDASQNGSACSDLVFVDSLYGLKMPRKAGKKVDGAGTIARCMGPTLETLASQNHNDGSNDEYGFTRKGCRRPFSSNATWEALHGISLPNEAEHFATRDKSPDSTCVPLIPHDVLRDMCTGIPIHRRKQTYDSNRVLQAKSPSVKKIVTMAPPTPRTVSPSKWRNLEAQRSRHFEYVTSGGMGELDAQPIRHPTELIREKSSREAILGTSLPGCCNEHKMAPRYTPNEADKLHAEKLHLFLNHERQIHPPTSAQRDYAKKLHEFLKHEDPVRRLNLARLNRDVSPTRAWSCASSRSSLSAISQFVSIENEPRH